ncbi:MAG TPA: FdrA family protein, partial [Bdellovibrionales bacterium]|nr:FdrA family protein [Bdellovibrionales bacterium]
MVVKGFVRKGEYHDSVTLMRVAKFLSEQAGVSDSAIVMATEENKHVLSAAGLAFPEIRNAVETDLIMVVKVESADKAEDLLAEASRELKARNKNSEISYQPKSLDSALKILPTANFALISVAGRYAGDEAMKALQRGLHVMLFSDNVSIEKEIELKTYAASKDLLVMGPDAGTAIINGVPLAFANNVRRGNVGIVAASGTGLQEASTLISNYGAGISQAIGTGGRDVKEKVGGLMFLQAVKLLLDDPDTKVILLISKPPHESVLKKIIAAVKNTGKPVITTFLGSDPTPILKAGLIPTITLDEGAWKAARMVMGRSAAESVLEVNQDISRTRAQLDTTAAQLTSTLAKTQQYLRALYTGGTYVGETQVLLNGKIKNIFSNAPWGESKIALDSMKSQFNTIIDFGEDEFTVGRPHPMIDFSLRNRRILEEARDPETAVLLLDLVLGWGAHKDPLAELIPVLREAQTIAKTAGRQLPIVMCITGTDTDPQCRSRVVTAIKECG